jgi:biopolymer transport protein ExbD
MSTMTPLQRRAERKSRNQTMVDMNLVSLIDVFTILIFFLLSSAGVETALPSHKAVHLPLASVEQSPKENLAVIVTGEEIIVEGRSLAKVADVLGSADDVIGPLKDELALLAQRMPVKAENADKAKAITVVADKDVPYRLLKKVMVTGSAAGFADVSFAVQKKGDVV